MIVTAVEFAEANENDLLLNNFFCHLKQMRMTKSCKNLILPPGKREKMWNSVGCGVVHCVGIICTYISGWNWIH